MIKWISGLWGGWSQAKAQARYVLNLDRQNEKLASDKGELIKRVQNLQATIAVLEAQNEKEGPKRDLEKSNDAQAARAMSRNTKNDFREYQMAVKNVMAQFDKVMSKNSITKKDLDTVNRIREQMRAIVRREI